MGRRARVHGGQPKVDVVKKIPMPTTVNPRPEDMRLLIDMQRAMTTDARIPELSDVLGRVFQGYRENLEHGEIERKVWGRLNEYMKREGKKDPVIVLQNLIECAETEGESPERETIMAYMAKHEIDAKLGTVMVLNDIILAAEALQNTKHAEIQRVFDFNMDDIEEIMEEYNCTFNEALSLMISTFRRAPKVLYDLPKGPVQKK